MTTSNVELKEKIMTKLNDADLSEEKKEKIRKLNNSIGGSHSELLRKLLLAVVENKETDFRDNLEDIGSDDESSDDERVIEQIIELYESFTFSCIMKNDVDQLTTLLYYCNTGSSFFRRTFERICCIGDAECLQVALRRIFRDTPKIDENFMEGEPAKTLFDANFYRRIVEHNRVALIYTLFWYDKVNWKKAVMKELAEKGKYTKVAEYLRDPDSHRTISDPRKKEKNRKKLDYTERVELANRLQEAVKNKEIVKLEQHLQDLEEYKKEYSNLDNLINETVSSEGGIWKNERLIHWACRQGDLAICKALYDKGASLRVLDINFHSPAHVAVEKNHLHVLKWLNNCDDTLIKSFFENGWTNPLLKDKYLFKLEKNNVNLPILEYLLSLGCDSLLKKREY